MGIIGSEEDDRHYQGRGLGHAPWKCPACGQEQVGEIEAGCPSCGSGTARAYKAQVVAAPPPKVTLPTKADAPAASPAYSAAERWADTHPDASLAEAFVAGFLLAQGMTMTAAPVSVDLARLAPDHKIARTMIAALELFRDQILPTAAEEIASGEWCSVDELNDLISKLQE